MHPVEYVTPGPEHAHSLVLAVVIAFDGYRSFASPGWQPPDELTPENVERMAQEIADPESFTLMAVYEGDPIGHVHWVPARESPDGKPLPEGLVHLRHLFVLEPWWGTEVARTLHARAVEAMGDRPARLYTPVLQARARRFYEREGWTLRAEHYDGNFGMSLAEYRRGLTAADGS